MKVNRFILVSCILIICACQVSPTISSIEPTTTSTFIPVLSPTPTQTPIPLTEAQQYLSDALEIIQENALNGNVVDWKRISPKLISSVKDAKSTEDTYATIQYVLRQLNDGHSHFLTSDFVENISNPTTANYTAPMGKLMEEKLGYVALFGFEVLNVDVANEYADKIQNIIIDLSGQGVCGWIVDLRDNTGGNMWPMIAGLGALIGEGELGVFKYGNGQTVNWFYHDGQSWEGDHPRAKVSHPEFILDPDEVPVAVLIGSQTASSGEDTAISFRGRLNTQLFGQPSRGLTTINILFMLSDGAVILLATSIVVDRTGQEYGGPIIPDVTTSDPEGEAVDWLLKQPACEQ